MLTYTANMYSLAWLLCICIFRPRTGPVPPALNPPQEKAMTIYFSAILPMEAWEWDNTTSSVYMRFENSDLNACDVGPGCVAKYVCNISLDLHNNYVVHFAGTLLLMI